MTLFDFLSFCSALWSPREGSKAGPKGNTPGLAGQRENTVSDKTKFPNLVNFSEEKYPEKTKYATTTLYLDLLNFAARYLAVDGRVSFWYPVLREL